MVKPARLVVLLIAAFALALGPRDAGALAGHTVADRVFGQAGSFTTNVINNGGVSASGRTSAIR